MEWQRLNATYASAARRTSTTRSTASKPTRRSFGITPTASASAISTSTARATATSTDPAHADCMPISIGAFNNSYIGSPNGNGLILDLAYLPFSHGAPVSTFDLERAHRPPVHRLPAPLRRRDQFRRFVSRGTHNASGNNSVFAYAWWRSEGGGRRERTRRALPTQRTQGHERRLERSCRAMCNHESLPARADRDRRLAVRVRFVAPLVDRAGSPAFALEDPDSGHFDRRRRGASEQQPRARAHGGNFRHRHQYARMDGHLFRPHDASRSAPISTAPSPISG